LHLGNKKTVIEALRWIRGLEVTKWITESSTRPWNTSDWTLWRGQLPPKWKKRLQTAQESEI
jgi:hypothetical protein